jgi:protease IV
MNKGKLTLWLIAGGVAFLFFVLSLAALVMYVQPDNEWDISFDSGQVALIEIYGTIYDPKPFVEQLKLYRKQSQIKALVLHINSPGGGAAASQEIYSEVLRVRKEYKKKVIAAMGSVAASGGYYVACAADKIVANPATVTGSIGVIAEWINWGELMSWAKLKSEIIKSGEYKDAGNPSRPLTENERRYFQGLIDGLYQQFVQAVADGRHMSVEQVKPLADGRVFTGEDALRKGLVDEMGTLQDAIRLAGKMTNLSGEPKVVTPKKKKVSLWDLLLNDASTVLPFSNDPSQSSIRFQYLWR